MFDNVGGGLQDGMNLDSAIHKEAETKKGPDHGDLWKLSYRYWTLFSKIYSELQRSY